MEINSLWSGAGGEVKRDEPSSFSQSSGQNIKPQWWIARSENVLTGCRCWIIPKQPVLMLIKLGLPPLTLCRRVTVERKYEALESPMKQTHKINEGNSYWSVWLNAWRRRGQEMEPAAREEDEAGPDLYPNEVDAENRFHLHPKLWARSTRLWLSGLILTPSWVCHPHAAEPSPRPPSGPVL